MPGGAEVGAGGGGGRSTREGSEERSNPLPLYILFLTGTVNLSYAFPRKCNPFIIKILVAYFHRISKCPADIFLPKTGPPEKIYSKKSPNH